VPAVKPVIGALVAFCVAVVVTKPVVKVELVARSISKFASFCELSVQVRLICVELAAEAPTPLGAAPPRMIPPPNVATQTSLELYGLIKTFSGHECGNAVRSTKFADENPATVTSGA
jgi:hypothetical protein